MIYDHNDLNGQNLDQNSQTSDQKMDKKRESSIKPMVRFSEPIAEYRTISDAGSGSDTEQICDKSLTDSWATKGLKKCLWKLLIYVCIFIFIVVIVLCGFFSDHAVVQNVIFPIGVAIVFCIVFYRAVMGSGISQREEGFLEGYGDGYENNGSDLEENLLDENRNENDIKSSI